MRVGRDGCRDTTSFPVSLPSFPRPSSRHSRESGNLDTRYYGACLDVGPILRRPPRRPGAEERRACGDEQAASKEEQEQQPS